MDHFSSFWSRTIPIPPGRRAARIAFSDSSDPRVLKATKEILDKKDAAIHPVLVGNGDTIRSAFHEAFGASSVLPDILPPLTVERRREMAQQLRRKDQKISEQDAHALLDDTLYHGVASLMSGEVDGLVAGSLRPTADVVRATLHHMGTRPHHKLVSGQFLVESLDQNSSNTGPYLFSDCAVVPEPSSRSLATIAATAAESYRFFTGGQPRVAFLSFSTKGSAEHPLVDRIREAHHHLHETHPEIIADGELQLDAAVDGPTATVKNAGGSPVAGHANVFVFPTLEAGNIAYKMAQRFGRCRVAGPILWGLEKPVSDLSRGCTVDEIIDTARCVADMHARLS